MSTHVGRIALAGLAASVLFLSSCSTESEPLANRLAVSRDGRFLLFCRSDDASQLTLHDRNSRAERPVGPRVLYGGFTFSPDEASVICSYSKDGALWRIGRFDIATSQMEALTEGNDYDPVLIAEGRVLFWRSLGRSGDLFGGTNPSDLDVFILDLADNSVRRLTHQSFFLTSDIVYHEGTAFFTESGRLFSLDILSGELQSRALSDQTFNPLCATRDGKVIGSILERSPHRTLPAEFDGKTVEKIANISQVDGATFASESNTVYFGCRLPWAIYSYERETGVLRKEPIEWHE